jgi:hypothetical protein
MAGHVPAWPIICEQIKMQYRAAAAWTEERHLLFKTIVLDDVEGSLFQQDGELILNSHCSIRWRPKPLYDRIQGVAEEPGD